MKRSFYYIYFTLLLGIAGMFAACEDGLYNDYILSLQPHTLSIGQDYSMQKDFEATYRGETIDVNITAENTGWQFEGMAEWVSLSPRSGSGDATATMAVAENLLATSRTSVFQLQSKEPDFPVSINLAVNQDAANPYATAAETSLSFPAVGGTTSVGISSNYDYSVSESESWMEAEKSSDGSTVAVMVSPNTTTSKRYGKVSVGEWPHYIYISVEQDAPGMTCTEEGPIHLGKEGGKIRLKIDATMDWTATSNGNSWFSITPDNGTVGTTQVDIDVVPNNSVKNRYGYADFKIGSSKLISIRIEQDGLYIRTANDVSQLTFDADACTRTLEVESNTQWKVLSKPDWLQAPSETFKGNATLQFRVADYNQTVSRTGTVKLGAEGLSLTKDIKVTQNGRTFANVVSSLQFDAPAGAKQIDIVTDGAWTATPSQAWLSVSPASGKGNAQLTVSVNENTTDDPREAAVSIKVGATEQTVIVKQLAHYLTIHPTEFSELPSTGGSHQFTIASDDHWTAMKKAEWLTINPDNGTGQIEVTATAADNPSLHTRRDTIRITPDYAQPVKAIVQQAARYMTVETKTISFTYLGGESERVMVNTDGSFSVTADVTWLTVNRDGNAFTVTATMNSTEEVRTATITVQLTGLPSGQKRIIEIPVVQYSKYSFIGGEGFGNDEDWNLIQDSEIVSIEITTYDNDEDWNIHADSDFKVTVEGFDSDSDWDTIIK